MKRIILFISLALLNYTILQAQYPNLRYSEKSPEVAGNYRVKLLKNGNTAFFNFSQKEGVKVTLYDPSTKIINDEKLKLTYLKYELKYYRIRCILEINNDIMLMFEGLPLPAPTLYRVLIDGSTGKIKKEEEAVKVNVTDGKKPSAELIYQSSTNTFTVKKDPNSDYYAVVIFNEKADDPNKKIEVVHFNPSHIQVNRAFFQYQSKYKFLNYSDIEVNGDNYVIASIYAYNTKASSNNGQTESVFYLAKLSKGMPSFKNYEISYASSNTKSYGFTQAGCKFSFDKSSNTLYAFLDTYSNFDKSSGSFVYNFFIQPLNPDNMEMRKTIPISLEKANNYYHTKINPKDPYTGMPQSFFIDRTNNHLILLNEMPITIYNQGVATELRDPAITDITNDGKENYSIVIPYNHWTLLSESSFNYLHNKNGYIHQTTIDEFNSTYVDLVPGEKYNYLFLNNTLLNYGKPDNDKNFEIRVRPSMNLASVIYKIDKQGNMTKSLLLGNLPKNETKYCLFNSADFNPETNTYATVVVERGKAGKNTSVVWLTLE